MSDAVQVAVRKAVAARLNTLQFSQQFLIREGYAEWDLDLKELDLAEMREFDKLMVDVVSHTTEQAIDLSSRGSLRYQVPIDIAIRRKFGADKQDATTGRIETSEIDELVLFVQEVHEAFTKERLAEEFDFPVWDGENGGTRLLVCPMREHLRTMRQFTAILRIVFRADKRITAQDQ